jgi:hypothetical protein
MVDKRWKIRLKWHKITLYSHLLQGNEEQTLPLDLVFLELFPSSFGQSSNKRLAGKENLSECYIIHPLALMVSSVLAVDRQHCVPLC